MTPTSLLYALLGLLALLWPLALLLFKPRVLGAQWLLAVSMLLLALSLLLYSCLFNTFLSGEYLLVVLYMLLSLATPPATALAVAALTRPQGLPRLTRAVFIPLAAFALLMAASVLIGGPDMYRLWIQRGTLSQAHILFPRSWRYDLIVIVHLYLFSILLTLETLALALYTILTLRRYRSTVRQYYTSSPNLAPFTKIGLFAIALLALVVSATIVLFPLNAPRPLPLTLLAAILQGVAIAVLGRDMYRISFSAETLRQRLDAHPPQHLRRDLPELGRQLSRYIENGAFRDPDLSVFSLAEHFRVPQDQIVDALHRLHGQPFADYIDSVRIHHALLLLDNNPHPDTLDLARIAHQCGYLQPSSLLHAYAKILHTPFPTP